MCPTTFALQSWIPLKLRTPTMYESTTRLALFAVAAACLLSTSTASAEDAKRTSLLDGKSRDGWEKIGAEASKWEVKGGGINGWGPGSMLVCTNGPYTNFRCRGEIKVNARGNAGLYF